MAPQIYLLIEWPSGEAALTFYDGEEYAPYRRSRPGGSAGELVLVAGEDVTGTARIVDWQGGLPRQEGRPCACGAVYSP